MLRWGYNALWHLCPFAFKAWLLKRAILWYLCMNLEFNLYHCIFRRMNTLWQHNTLRYHMWILIRGYVFVFPYISSKPYWFFLLQRYYTRMMLMSCSSYLIWIKLWPIDQHLSMASFNNIMQTVDSMFWRRLIEFILSQNNTIPYI